MALRIAAEAEAELDEIWLYVASDTGTVEAADRLIDSITERLLLLARNPHIGRRRDEELRPGLRSFAVNGFVIIYRTPRRGCADSARSAGQPGYWRALERLVSLRAAPRSELAHTLNQFILNERNRGGALVGQMRRGDQLVTVPVHAGKVIGPGLLKQILDGAGLDYDGLRDLL
jgi:plasmid stabilization system protein ParE